MTLEEALGLRVGDVLVSRFTARPWHPVRIAAVWVNAAGRGEWRPGSPGSDGRGVVGSMEAIVRVRLPSIEGSGWLDPLGFELPSVRFRGRKWCGVCGEWETRLEKKLRHGTDRSFHVKGLATPLSEWSRKSSGEAPEDE